MKNSLVLLSALFLVVSCNTHKNKETIVIEPDQLHASVDRVTEIMIHDIFSPPVASRVYVYPNIAAYEIIAQANEGYESLAGQLTGLNPVPAMDSTKNINPQLAALIAHMDVSKSLIFSENRIKILQDSLYGVWSAINLEQFNDDPSRWQPTPPAYMDGIEPQWNKIRPFVIDSASQFRPTPPPPFSMEKGSDFYKEVKDVYDISMEITERGDDSEEIAIAQFWDCNPYVSVTRGHLMFATKKISPGAHWIGIAKIASKKSNNDFDQTVYAYTKTSIAIADAFISCWDEKYRSNLIRPETLINQHIDENWKPVLQTPPFPEYTSGHSVVSGAAATALTNIYGEDFAFDDDTEVAYGLPVRSFASFKTAANEAAISRMYGGIHYRTAVDVGVKQGRDLGKFVIDNLKMNTRSSVQTN